MIQMLCVGPGAGWRRRIRLWWLTSSSTLGCWRRWRAPASSCFTWSSGRSGTGTSGGGTAWPSSASGGSAVCSVPPGFSLSFLLNPQKPSSSSSASLTRYKVSFWAVSPFLSPHWPSRRAAHCLCGRDFLSRYWSQSQCSCHGVVYKLLLFNSSTFSWEFKKSPSLYHLSKI